MYVYIFVYVYSSVRVFLHTYATTHYFYTLMYVCMYVCIYVHIYMYVNICMYVYNIVSWWILLREQQRVSTAVFFRRHGGQLQQHRWVRLPHPLLRTRVRSCYRSWRRPGRIRFGNRRRRCHIHTYIHTYITSTLSDIHTYINTYINTYNV